MHLFLTCGQHPVHTTRLELIPMTADTCRWELGKDYRSLASWLDATVPPSWPPDLLDKDALEQFMAMISVPGSPDFHSFYWIKKSDPESPGRILIGSGGFFVPGDGIPEIGYSVLESFQNRGYASEAVRGMLSWLFSETGAEHVQATTFPDFIPSIKVLTKTGFTRNGTGEQEGSIRFELARNTDEYRA